MKEKERGKNYRSQYKFRFREDVDKNMQITVICKSHHESENIPLVL